MKKILLLSAMVGGVLIACTNVPPVGAEVTSFVLSPITTTVLDSPIPGGETVLYRVYCGTDTPYELGTQLEAPISAVLTSKPDGSYSCSYTGYYNHPCDVDTLNPICEGPKSNEVTVWKRVKYYMGGEPSNGALKLK